MRVTGEVKFPGRIFSFSRFSFILPITILAAGLLSGACTKVNEFTIGENFIESQARLQLVDTFKVNLSTVLLDSVVTSATKTGLAGSYGGDVFGSINCSAYFDLAYQTFTDLEEGAVFDSAAFVFPYSGSYYGDTVALMSLSVNQLTEKIIPNTNGRLYNTSFFDYSPVPLGTVRFYPSPRSERDTAIVIPVNDFGRELFTMFLNKDVIISSEDTFTDFLKGFVLSSSGENKAVVYFKADKENTFLRFYYHLDKEFQENKSISLYINETNHQFNRAITDFTNSPLKDLKTGHNLVKSSDTNNMAFIQGMSGLLAKIQFPTVQNILTETRWKILKAELVFEPVKSSFETFKLPEKLYLYDTDKANGVNSQFTDSEQNALLPQFIQDRLYNDTRYIFNITPFINSELSDHYFDPEHGLLIGIDAERISYYSTLLSSTLDRLLIESKNPPVKLRVYYLTY